MTALSLRMPTRTPRRAAVRGLHGVLGTALLLLATVAVLLFLVYPVAYVFYGSLKPGGGMLGDAAGFTLANYRRIFASGFFTFAAEVDFTRHELATNWLDFSEGISPDDIATLPTLSRDPTSFYLLDFNYVCDERCVRTGFHMTILDLSSVTRSVASVPEPGTLGLLAMGLAGAAFATRRRRPVRV